MFRYIGLAALICGYAAQLLCKWHVLSASAFVRFSTCRQFELWLAAATQKEASMELSMTRQLSMLKSANCTDFCPYGTHGMHSAICQLNVFSN